MTGFITSLCESRLFPTRTAMSRFTARQIADILHLTICALYVLRQSPHTQHWAIEYARHTMRDGDIHRWQSNGTDLEIMIYALTDDELEFRFPDTSNDLRAKLHIDKPLLIRWLKSLYANDPDPALSHRLFARIDMQLKIRDSSQKAIRRLAQDWRDLTPEEAKLAMTRLLQMLRHEAPHCEVLAPLQTLARATGLEMHGVYNPETGQGGTTHAAPPVSKPKQGFLASLATAAVGGVLGYALTKAVHEDATAGATCSADVAAVAMPIGGVMRRAGASSSVVSPKTRKRKPEVRR